jgi:excisionase family DNA binding protein
MRNNISNNISTVELITLKQAAAVLQVCGKTVRRLIDKRQVPIFRVGNRIRMRADHVALLLQKE